LIEANSIKKNVFRIYRCQAIVLFQGNFDATHGHRFHDCFLPSTSVKLFHQAQFNSSAKLNSGFAKFWCQCNSNGVRKMCAGFKKLLSWFIRNESDAPARWPGGSWSQQAPGLW
jgi:hypothetical protein